MANMVGDFDPENDPDGMIWQMFRVQACETKKKESDAKRKNGIVQRNENEHDGSVSASSFSPRQNSIDRSIKIDDSFDQVELMTQKTAGGNNGDLLTDQIHMKAKTAKQFSKGSASVENATTKSRLPNMVYPEIALRIPDVVSVPRHVWRELVSMVAEAFYRCCEIDNAHDIEMFSEACLRCGSMQLHPRRDPDVLSDQLIKDIKRETIDINGKTFIGARNFDSLYTAIENIFLEYDPKLTGTPLEHKVQRILRGCSRTVSGYDAYDVVSGLFADAVSPKALVTPAMMSNSPISICFESNFLTLTSVNVFKASRELEDGSLIPVVIIKTEVVEQVQLDNWQTVRWMNLYPLDKVVECMNPIYLCRDRSIASFLNKSKDDDDMKKRLLECCSSYR